MQKIESALANDPWFVNSTSKVLTDEDLRQLYALPELLYLYADDKEWYTSWIKPRYLPLHLVLRLQNYSLAKILILQYGASVGSCDDLQGANIFDNIAAGQLPINDPELMQILISKRANRNPIGLIVGCGHGFGALNHGANSVRYSHSYLHRYEDFYTVSPLPSAKADFQCLMQDLPEDFLRQQHAKLKYVVFENVNDDILIPDPVTGHCKAFDLAYDLLTADGVCIIRIGWKKDYNQALLAQLSGFKYGSYFPFPMVGSTLYVKKDLGPITISSEIREIFKHCNSWTRFKIELDVQAIETQPIGAVRLVEASKIKEVPLTFSYRNSEGKIIIDKKTKYPVKSDAESVPLHAKQHPVALIIKDHFNVRLAI